MKKLSWFLWIGISVMIFLSNPVAGHAQEEVYDSGWIVNPLYEDVWVVPSEDVVPSDVWDIDSEDAASDEQFYSIEEAAAYLNQQMLLREEETAFTYYTQSDDYQTELREIINEALEWGRDTNPRSGDYLKFQYGGWRYSVRIGVTGSGEYRLSVTYTISYYTTYAMEQEVNSKLNTVMQELNLEQQGEAQKIRAIYDYICSHVTYDYENLNDSDYMTKYTAYGALIDGTSVCQGYAVLFYRMCKEAGIDTRVIGGYGYSERHAWNIVRVGDLYYNVDATWDASNGGTTYYYFLKSQDDFSGHTRDEEYTTDEFMTAYPMADTSYDITAVPTPAPTTAPAATPTAAPTTAPTAAPTTVDPVKFAVVGVIGGRNVTFSTDTEDAVIYYSSKTSSLTTEDACVENGETVLFEDFYGTIYARAYVNGQWGNVSRLILKIPVVSTPVISSDNGVVTIKTSTPNSTIYYTTDGSTPSPTNGKRLTNSAGSFTVPANCTVKAIAVRSCFTNSEIASASVTAKKLGAPSFAVKGVIGGRAVTFNTTEEQGEIYYSFTTSNITTKDLHVKPGETVLFENYYGTVYAKTYVNGQWSNVSRLILKIPVVNTPTITDAGNGKVKISTSTPNCTIYYTTDGSTPSPTNGTRINSSSSIITVGSGKTVKAIAVRSCFTNSEVATYKK